MTSRTKKIAFFITLGSCLVAVTARTNRSKADQDPAQWLPPHPAARCTYLADWITVKTTWKLTINPAEHTALHDLAADCPTTRASVPTS